MSLTCLTKITLKEKKGIEKIISSVIIDRIKMLTREILCYIILRII